MKKYCILLIIFISLFAYAAEKDKAAKSYIERTSPIWKVTFIDVNPEQKADSWMVPFMTKNRFKLNTIKVISVFGDHRDTYLRGHIHTATDIIPSESDKYIYVYPMAKGIVCSIHLTHPHKTIVIKHVLSDGSVIYTSYKHLQEIYVKRGMNVDQSTKLARLYTREEAQKQGGSYDHLHLEIRKSIDDYGCASWLTMTKDELNKYFYNPMNFMKMHLGEIKRSISQP